MKRLPSCWLLVALVVFPAMACAEAAVRTGEHPGFTRLVVEDPSIRSWQLGRSAEGYRLRLTPTARAFALSRAFRAITRKRLASLAMDGNGDLDVGLGCACHIEAFEIRPGVIVLDIRDGPPSSPEHEQPLPVEEQAPEPTPPAPDPAPSSGPAYDWRKVTPAPLRAPELVLEAPVVTAMRQSLVEQLSRGAAAGAVDFAGKPPPPKNADTPPAPNVRILPEPGFEVTSEAPPKDRLTAEGSPCPSDERFDVAAWRGDSPVAEQIGAMLAGLTGEFDDPQAEPLARAVRFYLSLGFGAEARQLLAAFPVDHPDRGLWEAMAHVLDGERQPGGPLAAMALCDGAAALWSVLADPPPSLRDVNAPAVLRAFSGLPPDLRQELGPRLAENFLAWEDPANAQAIREALVRGAREPTPAATLTDARLAAARGEAPPAADLSRIGQQPGPEGAEALALLVEGQVAEGKAPSAQDVLSLGALYQETEGTDLGQRVGRAYRLALAATGDYDRAFSGHALAPDADAEVWRILAVSGPDSQLLERAVLSETEPLPSLPDTTRRALADRLRALGLERSADRWHPAETATAAPPDEPPSPPVPADAAGPSSSGTDAASLPPAAAASPSGPASLTRSRALVEESARARQRIEDLLRAAGGEQPPDG
ncbi:serine/threonine-protein kinase [Cereibacter sphaeroides]|uniref:hypothetical protein n=1 Tax=Cereibacter sphaeroides TaxID=1063 RepID=UPI00031E2DBF|nr:hypothetical protein [Cereibacter sphaeroides]